MHSSCRHTVRQTKHRVHILQAALLDQEAGSLRSTVFKIEKDTKATARRTWKKMYGGIEPYGVVVAKIDVYDILIGEPQETLNGVCLSLATGITVSNTSSTSLGARSQGSESQQVPRVRRTLQRHGGRHPDHPGQHPYCGETRMHVGTQLARWIYDPDKVAQQNRFPIRSWRGPSKVWWQVVRVRRLFYLQNISPPRRTRTRMYTYRGLSLCMSR